MRIISQRRLALLTTLSFLCLTALQAGGGSKPKESKYDTFKRTWEYKALQIQRDLQKNTPLVNGTI